MLRDSSDEGSQHMLRDSSDEGSQHMFYAELTKQISLIITKYSLLSRALLEECEL